MFVCPECGTPFPAAGFCTEHGSVLVDGATDALLGARVGSWRIARLLGKGAMGEVYLGVQPEIGGRVAIKVLSIAGALNPQLVERFFAEARAVNLVRHENIVNVLDLAQLPDGRPYIVMEYLEGAVLSTLIERQSPLSIAAVTRATLELLDALATVHARGIVHRDLKPDNVFVTAAGRVKVLDFGIAKLGTGLAQSGLATRTGALLGTPHYMSPEQALGRVADQRSDVYSAGVILYEALTGKRPFEAESLYELLEMHAQKEPLPPTAIRADIPPALEACVLTAMAKDPSARYADASDFLAALETVARTLPHERLSGASLPAPARERALANTAWTHSGQVVAPVQEQRAGLSSGAKAFVIACAVVSILAVGAAAIALFVKSGGAEAAVARVASGSIDRDADALRLARTHFSDAELVNVTVTGLRPDGTVVVGPGGGSAIWAFFSPKGAADAAQTSSATPPKGRCLVMVFLEPGGGLGATVSKESACLRVPAKPPRCTAAQMARVARKGVSTNGTLRVFFDATQTQEPRLWEIEAGLLTLKIPDEC